MQSYQVLLGKQRYTLNLKCKYDFTVVTGKSKQLAPIAFLVGEASQHKTQSQLEMYHKKQQEHFHSAVKVPNVKQ